VCEPRSAPRLNGRTTTAAGAEHGLAHLREHQCYPRCFFAVLSQHAQQFSNKGDVHRILWAKNTPYNSVGSGCEGEILEPLKQLMLAAKQLL
jgi:hypothetical protein